MEPRVVPFVNVHTTWWMALALTAMVILRQPSGVTTTPAADPNGRPVIYVPPRAYLLCWKGVCDPRVWAEMAKRTPFYNFGLGKRSSEGATFHYDEEAPLDGDSDNDQLAPSYGEEENYDNGDWNEEDQESADAEKRAKYGFGVGKKNTNEENRRFNFGIGKRGRDFSFGLGKREDGALHHRFGFGLGKREANPDAYYDTMANHEKQDVSDPIDDPSDLYQYKRDRSYSFGLGKRSKAYNFGLGKRDRMYGFGLGKRDRMYGFGLGKRDKMYGFGLGKRGGEATGRNYGFGLGKRDRMYGFGLGKRDSDIENEYDVTGVSSDVMDDGVKRSKSYAFGLGKRSTSGTGSGNENEAMTEKRGKFSFGIGKRSSAEEGEQISSHKSQDFTKAGKEVETGPTKTPSFVGQHQQHLTGEVQNDGSHSHQ